MDGSDSLPYVIATFIVGILIILIIVILVISLGSGNNDDNDGKKDSGPSLVGNGCTDCGNNVTLKTSKSKSTPKQKTSQNKDYNIPTNIPSPLTAPLPTPESVQIPDFGYQMEAIDIGSMVTYTDDYDISMMDTPEIMSLSTTHDTDEVTPGGPICRTIPRIIRHSGVTSEDLPNWYKESLVRPFMETTGGYHPTAKDSGIVDILNYSTDLIYLYTDGSIRKGDDFIRTNEGKITSIISFDGYILANINDTVYYLIGDTYDYNTWEFTPYTFHGKGPTITNIDRVSSTLDGDTLCVQKEDKLYLYDLNGSREEVNFLHSMKRVYGNNRNIYADIDLITKKVKGSDGKEYESVLDVIIDASGNVTILSVSKGMEKGYTSLRLVNWRPYYLICS
jgi:hypothetical protein